jgi:hypothetical protein
MMMENRIDTMTPEEKEEAWRRDCDQCFKAIEALDAIAISLQSLICDMEHCYLIPLLDSDPNATLETSNPQHLRLLCLYEQMEALCRALSTLHITAIRQRGVFGLEYAGKVPQWENYPSISMTEYFKYLYMKEYHPDDCFPGKV